MANEFDKWTQIEVEVWKVNYVKETDKAHCFKLWGKAFRAFPKQFVKNFTDTFNDDGVPVFRFQLPHWFVEENGLRSLVQDAHIREVMFPKKARARKVVDETPSLFEGNMATTATAEDTPKPRDTKPDDIYEPGTGWF